MEIFIQEARGEAGECGEEERGESVGERGGESGVTGWEDRGDQPESDQHWPVFPLTGHREPTITLTRPPEEEEEEEEGLSQQDCSIGSLDSEVGNVVILHLFKCFPVRCSTVIWCFLRARVRVLAARAGWRTGAAALSWREERRAGGGAEGVAGEEKEWVGPATRTPPCRTMLYPSQLTHSR